MDNWNEHYRKTGTEDAPAPSKTLVDLLPFLPKGRALDIACGKGRNSLFLAKNGWEVDAVDGSAVAIVQGKKAVEKAGVEVNFIEAELDGYKIDDERYDLIINFNFLDKNIGPEIVRGLKPGGAVLFETFTIHQPQFGPPRNPAFLLKENELLLLFSELHVAYYREGIFGEGAEKKAAASILAYKTK